MYKEIKGDLIELAKNGELKNQTTLQEIRERLGN